MHTTIKPVWLQLLSAVPTLLTFFFHRQLMFSIPFDACILVRACMPVSVVLYSFFSELHFCRREKFQIFFVEFYSWCKGVRFRLTTVTSG